MAKGAVDLDDRVMVFSLFPTCAFLFVMVKQINFNFRMRKFRAGILHHVFDCLGHANAMPTICCLRDLMSHTNHFPLPSRSDDSIRSQ